MKEQLLERLPGPEEPETLLDLPGPDARVANVVFRRQERFWKEVRKRIAERNPAVQNVLDRLY